MHELVLMRHAAAVPAAIDGDDFARPLSASGRMEALQAAARLAGEAPAIERILYSPAQRTSTTAQIVAAEFNLEAAALVAIPELYVATPAAIRAAIAREHGGARALLIVGHNPGISEFGAGLARQRGHLHTAGYWRHHLDAHGWRQLLGAPERARP